MIITIKYNMTDKCENVFLCNTISLQVYLTRCFGFSVYCIPNASVSLMKSLWNAFFSSLLSY